ncbi:MAG: hypothetical protein GF311_16985 [Candidatus Lokiarchaeota archaeon]|nr:hypothetical protein [Candidatus Lokiarchaeota archaeon]
MSEIENNEKTSFKSAITAFLKALKSNKILGYIYVSTILLIISYISFIFVFGPADDIPEPLTIPDIQDIAFILLIGFSFYLFFLFILTFIPKAYNSLQTNNTILKMIGIHILFIIASIFIPISIFIMIYIISFFAWYIFSSLFLVMFAQDISLRTLGKIILKNRKLALIIYIIIWFISFSAFGALFFFFNFQTLNFNQQMILLVFPFFHVLLPIIGLLIKPKSNKRAPISLYGLLMFLIVLYQWTRYFFWTPSSVNYSFLDAIIDISLVSYSFFSLFKNANKIRAKISPKIQIDSILLLFIWTRISSMILLLSVGEFTLFGNSATEGSYLISIFLTILTGLVLGILWIRRGIKKEDLKTDLSLPEIAGDHIR